MCDTDGIDAVEWNEPDCWKFAWDGRGVPYWCFGETGWGDQYAYSTERLLDGEPSPVFFLDALSMNAEIVAHSFQEFLEKEFLRNAIQPYDDLIQIVRARFPSLDLSCHLVHVPSLLLGGSEDDSNVDQMNARAAMIINGDIAIQVDNGSEYGRVIAVETFEDNLQRMRLRLVWE